MKDIIYCELCISRINRGIVYEIEGAYVCNDCRLSLICNDGILIDEDAAINASEIDLEQLELSPKEKEFIAGREFIRDEIYRAIRPRLPRSQS